MRHRIKTADELAWMMDHTGSLRGGQILDLHVHKRWVFDEATGRDMVVGTVIAVSIRYARPYRVGEGLFSVTRVAKLTLTGVSDFSIFEQDGAGISDIGEVHAEIADGRLRFWFDPCGELYVICEEAELEEVSRPRAVQPPRAGTTEWTFQAATGPLPSVQWFLDRLDRIGLPCVWREIKPEGRPHPARRWEGRIVLAGEHCPGHAGVHVLAYGPLDDDRFGVTLRMLPPQEPMTMQLLMALADLIAGSFTGLCLAGNQVLEPDEWLAGQTLGRRMQAER
jgi:hypothetical protein